MTEPVATRPHFPSSYGISEDSEGLLPWSWADERLTDARNYWICTASGRGRPHAAPVWGVWVDGAVHFGTAERSRKARNLDRDPRVVVHLESGEEVVILEGSIERAELSGAVADAFAEKYDFRPQPEQGGRWYCLRPSVAYAWLERDYPGTATRYAFR